MPIQAPNTDHVKKIARSFGISASCLARWLRIADQQDARDGVLAGRPNGSPAASAAGDLEAENRELRRRTKQLEQENEILRRATAYFARDTLPK